jgi:putative nucleotidyltransferase with HDIG domain
MPTGCGQRKLRRGSYQTEMCPGIAAREMRRRTALRTSLTPSLGTDGSTKVPPVWGRFKLIPEGLLKSGDESVDTALAAFALALSGIALGLALALVFLGYPLGDLWAVAALSGTALVAERGKIKINSTATASISLFPTLIAAVLFGPLAAMVVSTASMLGDFPRPYVRWLTYASGRSIGAAFAGLFAYNVGGDGDVSSLAMATMGAVVIAQASDVAFGALLFRLRGHGNPVALFRTLWPLLVAALPLYAPVAGLLVFGYREVSPWTLPLFLAPALAAQRSFLMYQDQRRLAEDLSSANLHLERANLSFAGALVATLDARDRYTAGHSAAVAIYARDIASRMGLSEADIQLAHVCGLVHDIGKVGLPPGLLEKPGALTLEERRQMEEHPVIGERILRKVDDYSDIAKIVRHHHERVDGQGYPDGLCGEDVPLLSRIIAVADAYNAMTSDRPYRDAMPSQVARMRLAQAVESQFDTSVAAAFEAILRAADEEYRSGSRFDFGISQEIESGAAIVPTSLRAAGVA